MKTLDILKRFINRYIDGMYEGRFKYKFPTFIVLVIFLMISIVESFPIPTIIRIVAGCLTIIISAIIVVFRR